MLAALVWTLLIAGDPSAKLEASVGKEMTTAIIAVNKALGLETWAAHGAQPCVDRGGLEALGKDVGPEETRRCASAAITKGFPGLGANYVLGIPMVDIGPVTVFAIGIADSDGWGAYSCDPSRMCGPTTLGATSNQAIGAALRHLRYGDADVIIAGGTEGAITPLGVSGFCQAQALTMEGFDDSESPQHDNRNRLRHITAKPARDNPNPTTHVTVVDWLLLPPALPAARSPDPAAARIAPPTSKKMVNPPWPDDFEAMSFKDNDA